MAFREFTPLLRSQPRLYVWKDSKACTLPHGTVPPHCSNGIWNSTALWRSFLSFWLKFFLSSDRPVKSKDAHLFLPPLFQNYKKLTAMSKTIFVGVVRNRWWSGNFSSCFFFKENLLLFQYHIKHCTCNTKIWANPLHLQHSAIPSGSRVIMMSLPG